MFAQVGTSRLELAQGDITRQEVDAIVNAANDLLIGGGGVDGALRRAAGPDVSLEISRKYPKGCPTGQAVVSSAGKLSARFLIHAVGPIWRGGQDREAELLRSAYRSSLELAVLHECRSVACPAISTGIYGYPMDLAADTAIRAVRDFLQSRQKPELVRFVLFDPGSWGAFARVLESLLA